MAGDWIKVRCDLQTHPKVVRILSAMRLHEGGTATDKFRVIGGLHAVWTVFDQHSVDGLLPGYTPEIMDHVIGWDGFSAAMLSVGWLGQDGPETLVMPEFDEHNGKSAKRRAEDQKRKRDVRRASENVPDDCGQNADKKRTREEKRRVKKDSPNGESGKRGFPPAPHQQIVDLYHDTCPQLPKVIKLTPARQQAIRARWRNELPSIEHWQRYFQAVAESDFLSGRANPRPGSDRSFVADFDFLIKQGNCVKVMEGRYDD